MRLALVPIGLAFVAALVAGMPESNSAPVSTQITNRKLKEKESYCGINDNVQRANLAALRLKRWRQDPELPEHSDHDCHWNERNPQPYYWYWARNTTVIIDTMDPTQNPDMNNLPPIIVPGTESGRELEIRKFRNAKLYNIAFAEDSVQSTGLQATQAELRWVPSPTWRNDIACCHPNECQYDWSDNLRVTMDRGFSQGNWDDYPKTGIATFGSQTSPCFFAVTWYDSGCPPMGIGPEQDGEKLEIYVRVELRQTSADTQAELLTSGFTKEYEENPPGSTSDYQELGANDPGFENADNFNFAGYEQYEQGEAFVLDWVEDVRKQFTNGDIHKVNTYMFWYQVITYQEANASNCSTRIRAECVPAQLMLFDNGWVNHFVAPGNP